MFCPRCNAKLRQVLQKAGFIHVCPSCNGRAVSLAVIRKIIPQFAIKDLWQRALSSRESSEMPCASCNHKMTEVTISLKDSIEHIDVCQRCHFVWFDPQEFEIFPQKQSDLTGKEELSLKAKEATAVANLDLVRSERELKDMGLSSPDHWWELALGICGVPVEYNNESIRRTPLVTFVLAGAIMFASCVSFFDLGLAIASWGLIPDQFTRYWGLTFITSFLVHGGVIHLLGNLYFLLIFGDNVEDTLGKKNYLLLIGLSSVVGDFAHIAFDPRPSVPVIGASGAISGILTYYSLCFPKAKVGFIYWFRWFRMPVGWMLAFWIVGQLLGTLVQISGFGNASALSHLGGAVMGVMFWLRREKTGSVLEP